MKNDTIPIPDKLLLTLEEASEYSNIGITNLRRLCNLETPDFIIQVGTKKLIKRKKFEAFLESRYAI